MKNRRDFGMVLGLVFGLAAWAGLGWLSRAVRGGCAGAVFEGLFCFGLALSGGCAEPFCLVLLDRFDALFGQWMAHQPRGRAAMVRAGERL